MLAKKSTNITVLQDYVKRLWNHSNTKIPITIGKGTDFAEVLLETVILANFL